MRAVLLAALVVLTACGSSPAAVVVTPSPTASAPAASPSTSASPSASQSPPRTPSPSASPLPHGFGIACRLPITWYPSDATATASNSGTGWFDARTGAVTSAAPRPKLHYLTGGPSYDAAVGKWLPVPASAIAPDGLHYAYAEWDPATAGMSGGVHSAAAPLIGTHGRVHLVDAQTGVDVILYSGAPTFAVAGYVAEGILLATFTAATSGTASSGLYLLDPTDLAPGHAPQPVQGGNHPLDLGGWRVIDGDIAAWGTNFSSGVATRLGPGNQLFRFDFSTLAVTSWLTAPADDVVTVLGLMNHKPVVLTSQFSYTPGNGTYATVQLLTGANQAQKIKTIDNPGTILPRGAGVQDSHGLWVGGIGALWLYDGKSLRYSAALTPSTVVDIAGGCA